tara:strand:+ start:266 stop:550 length:285 start_codon:yes stop_codon:yes gene_type:complete
MALIIASALGITSSVLLLPWLFILAGPVLLLLFVMVALPIVLVKIWKSLEDQPDYLTIPLLHGVGIGSLVTQPLIALPKGKAKKVNSKIDAEAG